MKISSTISVITCIILASACNRGPQPIRVGSDACSFCKMTISDKRFGAEIVTKKGKVYKFDDAHCVLAFQKTNTIAAADAGTTYVVNFNEPHELLNAGTAAFLSSPQLRSPMGGNIAAFPGKAELDLVNKHLNGDIVDWSALINAQE